MALINHHAHPSNVAQAVTMFNNQFSFKMYQLRNGKRAACVHRVMDDARGRLLSTKEA